MDKDNLLPQYWFNARGQKTISYPKKCSYETQRWTLMTVVSGGENGTLLAIDYRITSEATHRIIADPKIQSAWVIRKGWKDSVIWVTRPLKRWHWGIHHPRYRWLFLLDIWHDIKVVVLQLWLCFLLILCWGKSHKSLVFGSLQQVSFFGCSATPQTCCREASPQQGAATA